MACNAKLNMHAVEESLISDRRVDLHTIGCTALIRVVESIYWREITRSLHTVCCTYVCRNIIIIKDHVLRLVVWYDLAGEYLSNSFLRGSFPVMVSKARFTRTGGNAKFLEQSATVGGPPRLSCSFRIKICV